MRGLIVAFLILGWVPAILMKPHIGVLVWSWVSHMVPQFYTFNFARTFPFLVVIFGVTALGVLVTKDRTRFPSHPVIFALILYWIWITITTFSAFDSAISQIKLIHMSKVIIFTILAAALMQSPNRLKSFVWVVGLSLGFIAVKGGLFTLLTGGAARVEGAGGMMADNNQLAMAMAMFVPIAFYIAQNPPMRILKWPLIFASMLVPLAVVGTQSRGGFAALAAVVFMMILKTKHKFKTLIFIGILSGLGYNFMPDSYKNRISSSENATEDSSFVGRVIMWKFSVNLADDNPIVGGGFNTFYVQRAKELYMPAGHTARAPHSIYFEVLAEHGYPGLIIFLTLLFTGFYAGGTQAKKYRAYTETKWIGDLCAALQLSIVGYAVGGLTVNIATFDIFFHFLAIIVMCQVVGDQVMAGQLTKVGTNIKINASETSAKWSPGGAAAPQADR